MFGFAIATLSFLGVLTIAIGIRQYKGAYTERFSQESEYPLTWIVIGALQMTVAAWIAVTIGLTVSTHATHRTITFLEPKSSVFNSCTVESTWKSWNSIHHGRYKTSVDVRVHIIFAAEEVTIERKYAVYPDADLRRQLAHDVFNHVSRNNHAAGTMPKECIHIADAIVSGFRPYSIEVLKYYNAVPSLSTQSTASYELMFLAMQGIFVIVFCLYAIVGIAWARRVSRNGRAMRKRGQS